MSSGWRSRSRLTTWRDTPASPRRLTRPLRSGSSSTLAHQFRDFIQAGAVHYVQPDVVRLAGITEWWQVADLAHSYSLPVVPHVGDMCQVHQHLCFAHPGCGLLEYIPWLRDWMRHPARIEAGHFVAPRRAGRRDGAERGGADPESTGSEPMERVTATYPHRDAAPGGPGRRHAGRASSPRGRLWPCRARPRR
jgi:hypothetical protein